MAHDRLPKDRFRYFGNFLKRFDQHRSSYRIQAMEDYEFSIANTRFVASYGLIANCDIHAEVLQSSAVNLTYLAQINARLTAFPDISRPISIYVCTDALPEFAKSVLPNIDRPFTLVSGDSDMPVNATALGDAIALITNHPNLKNWFAQNIDCELAKLHALPIGLDLVPLFLLLRDLLRIFYLGLHLVVPEVNVFQQEEVEEGEGGKVLIIPGNRVRFLLFLSVTLIERSN